VKLNTAKDDLSRLGPEHTLWVYNALDSALTSEVADQILPLLDNQTRSTYAFSLSLQAPVLSMMRRGLRVDEDQRQGMIKHLDTLTSRLTMNLNSIAFAVWGKGLNSKSPKQVSEFFYDVLKLPEQRKRDKSSGERKRTTDRDALETLGNYFEAQPIVSHILKIRELSKLASTLRSDVSPDGRMRCSFNIAGTETGRFSSSSDAFDAGTNLQNQTERLRRIYVSDPGKKFASFDLKTGESFAVGVKCYLLGFGRAYLDACSGKHDLHTSACMLVWPELPWTGDPKRDKDIAERPFYRHLSYRDMAKRCGHGTNYYGTPWTIAKILKVQKDLIEEFQRKYFLAFPEIRQWHLWTAQEIQTDGRLTSVMGRRRHFFGRVRDDTTLREAIAYDPQSSIADFTNQWMLRVHRQVHKCQLLLQGHDALLVQYEEADEAQVVKEVQECAAQVRLGDERFSITIPTDASVGWNWGKADPKRRFHQDGNPFGLIGWSGNDSRKFTPPSLLDRRFC